MPTQLPRVPSLMPSSFATLAIGRDVSITIFTASSLNSGEKLFFGRGKTSPFQIVHLIGWTVRKARGTSDPVVTVFDRPSPSCVARMWHGRHLLIRSSMCGHPGSFRSVRDLGNPDSHEQRDATRPAHSPENRQTRRPDTTLTNPRHQSCDSLHKGGSDPQ